MGIKKHHSDGGNGAITISALAFYIRIGKADMGVGAD